MLNLRANIVDIVQRTVGYGELTAVDGRIVSIHIESGEKPGAPYLLPGFVDAHVHIESSMLVPDEFARAALRQGTLAAVSDPHEIANVLGIAGIEFMRERAALTPFPILFGAPSCVPATPFETAGATLDAAAVTQLLQSGKAGYLSEMMNFPGVLQNQPDVLAKLAAAHRQGVPVDGHAPGLTGADARQYAQAGITTDHECTTLNEALDKLAAGMQILIREGSAAQDYQALHPLLASHPDQVMFCSDDKHPDDLLVEHIRKLVQRSLALGYDRFAVLRAASYNAIRHYRLPLGLLQVGDYLDALLVSDFTTLTVQQAWLRGNLVVDNGVCLLTRHPVRPVNHFVAEPISTSALQLPSQTQPCRVIAVKDGQLWTQKRVAHMPAEGNQMAADPTHDVLFLAVVNRYRVAPPALALIHGMGLREGALASSVAHDSHNIVAVGSSATWLMRAINAVIAAQGGLAAVDAHGEQVLPLPVAGLMSDRPVDEVGPRYHALNAKAQQMGSTLRAPFMTLSFMALLVIPELKLSDRGLFDGQRFALCDLLASADECAQDDLWLWQGEPA